ncbi:MAG: PAS domain S-box protein [Methanoregulaceae archaeon]
MIHVLYIDDEPDLLELGRFFLEESGEFVIDTVPSAKQGIEEMKDKNYDAIVSDYQMHGMDGIALLKKLRSDGCRVPFILFTGRGREEVVIEALNSGADFYLQKGGDPEAQFLELAHMIRVAVEKRKSEENIRETNQYLTNLITNASGPIVTWDINFKITRFNRAFEKLTGFSDKIVLGQDFDILFPLESRADSLDLACRALFGEKWEAVEIPIRTISGEVRTVIWNSANIYAQDGTTLIATIAQGTDITERKKTEDNLKIAYEDLTATEEELRQQYEQLSRQEIELRKSRERLSGIFRLAPAGIGLIGNRIVLDINDRFCYMTGFSRDEIIGNDIRTIVLGTENGNPDGGPFGPEGDLLPMRVEARIRTKDGTLLTVLVSAAPLNPEDHSEGITFTVLDITDRIMAEDALRTANRKLGLLASITRHDILNKTMAIDGFLKIIRKRVSSDDITGYLDKLEAASHAIKSQIQFTRMYQALGNEKSLWQNVMEILPKSIPDTLVFEIEVKGIEVYADPMLERVFYNLLDNSLVHGGAVSRVRLSYRLTPYELTLVWEDNGTGIPPEEKERIFDQGYGKNTGLGLFLAQEILAITGIVIRETGIPGNGARFELSVPKGNYRITGENRNNPE